MIELGAVAEVAQALGVSKQVLCNWIHRYEDFPKPIAELSCGKIWDLKVISTWYKRKISAKKA